MKRSIAIIFSLAASLALAAPVVRADADPVLIDQSAGISYAVAAEGDLAVIGSGLRALLLDISDQDAPVLIGRTEFLPRIVRSLHLEGDRLIVGIEEHDVFVFDVSDPTAPVLMATMETEGEVRDMDADDRHVFMASLGEGLLVADVSTMERPRVLENDRTVRDVNDVIVDQGTVYLTSATAGLHVFSMGDGDTPELISKVANVHGGGKANQMALAGDNLYVANGEGVVVVGVADPSAPELLGAFRTEGTSWDIAAVGDLVYVADGIEGILVVDASDTVLPQPIGKFRLPFDNVRIAVKGDSLLAIDWVTGLHIIDISGDPTAVGSYSDLGFARSIARTDQGIFVALARHGLASLDPTTLEFKDFAEVSPISEEIGVRSRGDDLFFTDVKAGLWAFNASQPDNLRLYDQMPAEARDIAIVDDYAFMTSGVKGFQTVNLSDLSSLRGVQSLPTSTFSWGISIVDNLAYVADREDGIWIIDITTPARPVEVGRIAGTGRARDVEVREGLAYVANADDGLVIFDVETPSNPRLLGQFRANAGGASGIEGNPFLNARYVTVSDGGKYAFVANNEALLSIFDVTDPTDPKLEQNIDLTWPVGDMLVQGDRLYAAGGGEGLLVYQFEDGVGSDRQRFDLMDYAPLAGGAIALLLAGLLLFRLRRNAAKSAE